MGALIGRKPEQRDGVVNARLLHFSGGFSLAELRVPGGTEAGDLGLRSGPVETSGMHALALSKAPQGRAGVEGTVVYSLGVADGIALAACRVEETVGDQAVMLRVEPRDDREVIGKGKRRVARQHAFRGPDAPLAESEKVDGVIAFGVIPAETVQRDEHQ